MSVETMSEMALGEGGLRPLRCVFFSLICRAKGADLVLSAAERLPGVEFHLYGHVAAEFEDDFEGALKRLRNVEYHGVFDSVARDVYGEMNLYDLHLLPTSWPDEGVPGVLVETKIAAVPSIVSDFRYNSEIVEDGRDGIVLDECTAEALVSAIRLLDADRSRLDDMKANALASSERFYIDRYIDRIADEIGGRRRREGVSHG